MEGDKTVAKYMGYFILAILAIGGLGFLFVVYQFERDYMNGTILFVPFLAIATVAMALLWGGVAITMAHRSREKHD